MGCEEDSDYHQVVGDGTSDQGCGPVCQIRVVESQVQVIERAEKRSTPHGKQKNQFYGSLKGYVPRLARHEDFGRIFEGVSSSSAESVHTHDWSKQHQGRQGAYMSTPADQLHTATGLGARSSNQQRGRGVYASCQCLWPSMQYWGFL